MKKFIFPIDKEFEMKIQENGGIPDSIYILKQGFEMRSSLTILEVIDDPDLPESEIKDVEFVSNVIWEIDDKSYLNIMNSIPDSAVKDFGDADIRDDNGVYDINKIGNFEDAALRVYLSTHKGEYYFSFEEETDTSRKNRVTVTINTDCDIDDLLDDILKNRDIKIEVKDKIAYYKNKRVGDSESVNCTIRVESRDGLILKCKKIQNNFIENDEFREKFGKENLEKLNEYFSNHDIPENLRDWFFMKSNLTKKDNIELKFIDTTEKKLQRVLLWMKNGQNILFEGDAATGKNIFIEDLKQIFGFSGLHATDVQISSELSKDDILGTRVLKNGETPFELSPMIETFKNGGIIVLDEINTARADVIILLHSMLDDRAKIDIPGYGIVEKHPNTIIFGTLNRDYFGTSDMNEALYSRFRKIKDFEFLNDISAVLSKYISNEREEKEKFLNAVDNLYSNIKGISENDDNIKINIRSFISSAISFNDGMDIIDSLIFNIADDYYDDENSEVVKSFINKIKF